MAISLTGIILKGRYCVLEKIGKGGGGSLYVARDLELGTLWAVKEIPLKDKKEAKLLRLLEHPALPRMVDYLERGEFCYLVMEYIRGKSLGQWLREGRVFSLREILDTGILGAEVLDYLHKNKPPVYYGDMKPDNLMLSNNGKLYLVDLGSAVFGYGQGARVCQGTKGFAAPEQYEGRIGRESDVFALGKTLAALCGKNCGKYIMANPAFGLVLLRCCQKNIKGRYQDMVQVKKALEKAKDGRGRIKLPYAAAFAALCFCLGALMLTPLTGREEVSLEEALTQVTEAYYKEEFLKGSSVYRAKICREAEKKLGELWKERQDKESQRRILLLLALNGEMQGDQDTAEFYFRQLLLESPELGEGYGEYGCFLWRKGEREESRSLYKKYQALRREKKIAGEETRNIRAWRELVEKGRVKNEKEKKKE